MIGSGNHNNKNTIPTIRMIACPACDKPRLGKYANEDGSVDKASTQTVEVRGSSRYLEACEHCVRKYQAEDQRFVEANLRKLQKAFKAGDLPDEGSDHNDFSLN